MGLSAWGQGSSGARGQRLHPAPGEPWAAPLSLSSWNRQNSGSLRLIPDFVTLRQLQSPSTCQPLGAAACQASGWEGAGAADRFPETPRSPCRRPAPPRTQWGSWRQGHFRSPPPRDVGGRVGSRKCSKPRSNAGPGGALSGLWVAWSAGLSCELCPPSPRPGVLLPPTLLRRGATQLCALALQLTPSVLK